MILESLTIEDFKQFAKKITLDKLTPELNVFTGKNEAGKKARVGVQRTLVFDEIDTGIGGRAAEAVGKKLKTLSRANQILCVTHLPQIATFADHHYLIEKKESGGRTCTSVRLITGSERTEEVARMLSGAKLTETSRKHAEQMLKTNAGRSRRSRSARRARPRGRTRRRRCRAPPSRWPPPSRAPADRAPAAARPGDRGRRRDWGGRDLHGLGWAGRKHHHHQPWFGLYVRTNH